MKSEFDIILDYCVAQLKAGMSLEKCLSSYPAQSSVLKPLLMTYLQVVSLPTPVARQESIQRTLVRLRETTVNLNTMNHLSGKAMGNYFRWSIALTIVILITGFMAIDISAKSLPGDSFYKVKRGWEQIRLSLTKEEEERNTLTELYEVERLGEVQRLIQIKRPERVEFEAVLMQMDNDRWQVDGVSVNLDDSTVISGVPQVGMKVEVIAQIQGDGEMVALLIKVKEREEPETNITATPEAGLEPEDPAELEENFYLSPDTSRTRDKSIEPSLREKDSLEYDNEGMDQNKTEEAHYFEEYLPMERGEGGNPGGGFFFKGDD